ncbi:MAG TPA: hypothetical protein VF492_07910, partial [Verrucomicrobiae bacterium]
EADPSEMPETKKVKRIYTKADVLAHVPPDKPIAKDLLRAKANGAGIALNKINPMIAELLDDGTLFEWQEKRRGTNRKISLGRFPQSEPELIK